MKHAFIVTLIAAPFLLTCAAMAVPELNTREAERTACHTTYTGYLEGNLPFGLSADHYVVWPAGKYGPKLKLSLQRCPQITEFGKSNENNYWGRLIASETSTIKANQCLTITPPSSSEIIYLKLTDCGDEYIPPQNQTWSFTNDGKNDLGKFMWFVGKYSKCGMGHQSGWLGTEDGNDTPITTKTTHILKLSCDYAATGINTFQLSGMNS